MKTVRLLTANLHSPCKLLWQISAVPALLKRGKLRRNWVLSHLAGKIYSYMANSIPFVYIGVKCSVIMREQ